MGSFPSTPVVGGTPFRASGSSKPSRPLQEDSVFGSGSLWQKSVGAKNQSMDFSPKHTVLPDLRKASKSPDCGLWCPVRALKFYFHRTKPYRGEMDSLFLTTSKPVRVASKQTLSRWIISVIYDSICREELRLAGTHVRATTCALRQWHGHFTKYLPSRESWRHKAGVLHPLSTVV